VVSGDRLRDLRRVEWTIGVLPSGVRRRNRRVEGLPQRRMDRTGGRRRQRGPTRLGARFGLVLLSVAERLPALIEGGFGDDDASPPVRHVMAARVAVHRLWAGGRRR